MSWFWLIVLAVVVAGLVREHLGQRRHTEWLRSLGYEYDKDGKLIR